MENNVWIIELRKSKGCSHKVVVIRLDNNNTFDIQRHTGNLNYGTQELSKGQLDFIAARAYIFGSEFLDS